LLKEFWAFSLAGMSLASLEIFGNVPGSVLYFGNKGVKTDFKDLAETLVSHEEFFQFGSKELFSFFSCG